MKEHSHIGAYAVIVHDNQILLIEKARGPYTGLYDLPGGTIEFGESPFQTVQREVHEETGLAVTTTRSQDPLSCVFPYIHDDIEHTLHHIGFIFHCDCDASQLRSTGDGLDAASAAFIPLSAAVSTELTPFAQSVVERLLSPSA